MSRDEGSMLPSLPTPCFLGPTMAHWEKSERDWAVFVLDAFGDPSPSFTFTRIWTVFLFNIWAFENCQKSVLFWAIFLQFEALGILTLQCPACFTTLKPCPDLYTGAWKLCSSGLSIVWPFDSHTSFQKYILLGNFCISCLSESAFLCFPSLCLFLHNCYSSWDLVFISVPNSLILLLGTMYWFISLFWNLSRLLQCNKPIQNLLTWNNTLLSHEGFFFVHGVIWMSCLCFIVLQL